MIPLSPSRPVNTDILVASGVVGASVVITGTLNEVENNDRIVATAMAVPILPHSNILYMDGIQIYRTSLNALWTNG